MTAMPQHLTALDQANKARFNQADVKRELRDGTISLAAALHDARAAKLPISYLLMAQYRWGERRTDRLLRELRIGPLKRTGDLTDRQRRMIVDLVEGR